MIGEISQTPAFVQYGDEMSNKFKIGEPVRRIGSTVSLRVAAIAENGSKYNVHTTGVGTQSSWAKEDELTSDANPFAQRLITRFTNRG